MKISTKHRHEKFAQAYVHGKETMFNATKSAIAAGYSSKTARQIGQKLLTKVDILRRIDELKDIAHEKYKDDTKNVIEELKMIAYFDISEVLSIKDNRLTFKDWKNIPENARKMIQSVTESKLGIRVTFHSKTHALETLAKIFGLNNGKDKNRQIPSGPKTLEELVNMNEEELQTEIEIRKKTLKTLEEQLVEE